MVAGAGQEADVQSILPHKWSPPLDIRGPCAYITLGFSPNNSLTSPSPSPLALSAFPQANKKTVKADKKAKAFPTRRYAIKA
jgi:hypothetical protein